MNHNSHNNNSNNYKRRSSRYSNSKNYKGTAKKSSHHNLKNNTRNRNLDTRHKSLDHPEFSVTKQQSFDFDEMKFSDEIDTSFVDNKKKKEKIVDELAYSYEKNKVQQQKKENRHRSGIKVGRFVAIISVLILLLALLVVCIYIITKPVKATVVTREKEVIIVDDNYLFLGDSITEQYDLDDYYPDMNVVNSGISGNQTKDILRDLKTRAYQYNPSKIFLLIGTNDIQAEVEEKVIIKNIKEILSELKKNRPYAELYLEAIYPVDEDQRGAQIRTNEEIESINEELEEYCKKEKITFIDTFDLLLDSESDSLKIKSDYTKDGLHITSRGYEVITDEIMKYIK